MNLEKEDIEHIAKLANLNLTDNEIEQYSKELSAVLGYIKILEEVDTENVEETTQVTNLENVVRKDDVAQSDSGKVKEIVAQFPEKQKQYLKVKGVFE